MTNGESCEWGGVICFTVISVFLGVELQVTLSSFFSCLPHIFAIHSDIHIKLEQRGEGRTFLKNTRYFNTN